jgi:GNAT superfamily N-acetyltransferase
MRQARPGEEQAVVDLWTEAATWLASRGIDQWQYPPHLDRIERSIAAGECWLAVNEHDDAADVHDDAANQHGRSVGTITVDRHADPDFWTPADQPDAALYAHRMVVRRDYAGAGLGHLMLDHAGGLARDAGKRWLRLDAWRDNPGLHDYYLRLGFRLVRVVEVEGRRSGALFQREV